jgi:hypothetical protein
MINYNHTVITLNSIWSTHARIDHMELRYYDIEQDNYTICIFPIDINCLTRWYILISKNIFIKL